MSKVRISLNNNHVSRIGFGCWQLSGAYDYNGRPNGYGSIDTREAIKAIHMALEQGINFFDTAASYGYGKSEEVLAQALKEFPHSHTIQPLICTKFALAPGNTNEAPDYGPGNLVRSVEDSLSRLQVDVLDVLLLHNPPDDFDFSAYDTHPYEQLITQGKIKSYGISARTVKGARHAAANGFGSVIEAVYNPLDRRYQTVFTDPVYRDKYTFICRVPLASGFISPRTLREERTFSEDDMRRHFSSEQVAWVSDAVKKLSFLDELEGGIVVSALRFQLHESYNTIAVPGIKNTKQAADTLLALQLGPLSEDVIRKIEMAVPEVFYRWLN